MKNIYPIDENARSQSAWDRGPLVRSQPFFCKRSAAGEGSIGIGRRNQRIV